MNAPSVMEKTARHTDGPWFVDENGHVYARPFFEETTTVVDGESVPYKKGLIALIYTPIESLHGCAYEDVSAANSNLIAAAPDLLAALKVMEDTAMRLGLSRDHGDAAWANALLAHFAAINQARAAIAKAEGAR